MSARAFLILGLTALAYADVATPTNAPTQQCVPTISNPFPVTTQCEVRLRTSFLVQFFLTNVVRTRPAHVWRRMWWTKLHRMAAKLDYAQQWVLLLAQLGARSTSCAHGSSSIKRPATWLWRRGKLPSRTLRPLIRFVSSWACAAPAACRAFAMRTQSVSICPRCDSARAHVLFVACLYQAQLLVRVATAI